MHYSGIFKKEFYPFFLLRRGILRNRVHFKIHILSRFFDHRRSSFFDSRKKLKDDFVLFFLKIHPNQFLNRNVDIDLLARLTHRRVPRRLALLDSPARQIPQIPISSPAKKHSVFVIKNDTECSDSHIKKIASSSRGCYSIRCINFNQNLGRPFESKIARAFASARSRLSKASSRLLPKTNIPC